MKPDAPMQPLLALLQLGKRARAAASEAELGFVAVNETLQLLPYRQAALWTQTGLARVAAVSGLPQPDPNAPYVQWLSALFGHGISHWDAPRALAAADHEPLAAEWAQWLPAHAAWLPLRQGESTLGALLLARDEAWSEAELALLRELAEVYAHALAAFRPQQRGLDRIAAGLRTSRAKRIAIAAALAVCLVPVRISVPASAEVVPHQPLLVRAPLDGVIERMHVRPNQPVKAGDPLFSLDTTALRARHEVAQKAFDTAQEEFRQSSQAAVTDDRSRAEIAQRRGQLQEKRVELDFSGSQLERVQVKAERDGIAVFADANDWLGKAVAIGERVLLVADPARVELTAYLPTADQIDVQPGDTLTLYPQGAPLSAHEARIVSVAYRAELTPEGYPAYRVKAEFLPGEAPPRIGQLGTARLRGGWAPLAYVLLRRPLVAARQWLGW